MRWAINSNNTGSVRKPLAAAAWELMLWLVAIVVIAIIPSMLVASPGEDADLLELKRVLGRLTTNFIPDMRSYGLLILATAIISIVVYHLIVWKREYSQVFQPTTDYRVRRTLLPALGVLAFLFQS